jgi:hypothetical protein
MLCILSFVCHNFWVCSQSAPYFLCLHVLVPQGSLGLRMVLNENNVTAEKIESHPIFLLCDFARLMLKFS